MTSVTAPGREKLADRDPQGEERRAVEGVEELLTVPPREDEPGASEDVEVVGHGWRRDVEARGQRARGLLAVAEEADYLPPRGVSESFEGQIDVLIARILSHTSNDTPTGLPCLSAFCCSSSS
jgi:hypothetical protein